MHYLPDSNIVVGLDWRLYETQKDARAALHSQKNAFFARKSLGQECAQGVCIAKKMPRGATSGAMLLAEAAGSALAYKRLDDGQAWICAIKDGVPLQGFDLVTTEDEARNLLTEAMTYIPGADLYGDIEGSRGELGPLFDSVPPKRIKACQMRTQTSPIVTGVLVIGALSVIGAAGYGVMAIQEQQRLEKEGLKLSLLQMQQEEEVRLARERHRKEVEERIAKLKETLWDAVPPSVQIELWLSAFAGIVNPVNGWAAVSMECSPGSCEVKWGRPNVRVLPSAVFTLPGELDLTRTSEHQAITTHALQTVAAVHHAAGMDQWKFYDVSTQVTVSGCAVSFVKPAENIEAKTAENIPLVLAKVGNFSIQCSNLLLLKEMTRKLDLPGAVLTSIKVNAIKQSGKTEAIELNGKYRVTG